MTQRQLAEKYDGPECSNISPFYEWLPLLLLTQLHGQLLQRIIRTIIGLGLWLGFSVSKSFGASEALQRCLVT